MKVRLLILLLAIFPFVGIMAQQGSIKFTEYDLPNGLHVILHQDNTTPIVAVSILYHVGSKNEVPGRTGFAHFFEHLMFEGSDNIPRGDFDKITLTAGGTLNANTSQDRTFYYEIFPSNQLELGLWLESERLVHLRIDSTGVETQRAVVKEERKQSYDNRPYGSFIEKTMENAYKVHPYKWTPIGYPEDLNKATLQEFMEFHSIYYVPNNATLSIAGDLDIENTKKLIEKYFGDIPRGTKDIYRPNIIEPEKIAEVTDTIYDNIQLPGVFMSFHMPAQGTPDSYALSMLNTLLSDGQSSRMNKAIVDQQQKAVQLMSFPFALEDPGLFIILGIVNVGTSPADLQAAIITEIEKVKTTEIPDAEFQKLRNKVENDFVTGNSTMIGIAENLANYHVYFKEANLINTEIERYLKVTPADLQRVAQKYLTPENRVVLTYLPKPTEKN
ncbi:MAG: pitrilysin family protein [Bacteroidales bacterium]|nr:pitrilysin family protein [Bacteroidales bacterium]